MTRTQLLIAVKYPIPAVIMLILRPDAKFTTIVMLMENKTPFTVATEQFSMNISEPVTILELFIAKVGRVMLAHQPTRPTQSTRSTLTPDTTILNQAIIPRVIMLLNLTILTHLLNIITQSLLIIFLATPIILLQRDSGVVSHFQKDLEAISKAVEELGTL